jgi:ectoine hydroxylase-related dioxygenase (phytanoyl-CoA dioxygenase family)
MVSEEQKEQFSRDGFVCLPRLLSEREVAVLRAAIVDLGKRGFNLEGRQVGGLTRWDPRFMQLVYSPKVGDLIGEITTWESVYLHYSKVNFNCARTGVAKTWHQDNVYWPESPPRQITMWIAIDDADAANGCLWLLPGSHKNGVVSHTKGETGWEITDDDLPKLFPGLRPVQFPVKSGGALVFHGNVLHRSEPNRSERNRWAVTLGFDKQRNEIYRFNRDTNLFSQFDSFEIWRRTSI